MRKLIEITQDFLIQCDNQNCGYKVMNPSQDPYIDTKDYINKECPQCGSCLLTQADYELTQKLLKTVKFTNRWFSWLTLFIPKKKMTEKISAHVHNGVNINSKA
jgi:phage FluMu protein Com